MNEFHDFSGIKKTWSPVKNLGGNLVKKLGDAL